MSKHCDICTIDFVDEHSYHGHLLGKKHAQAVEFNRLRVEREQNSVFIAPVPPATSPQMLHNFFSTYGQIKNWTYNTRFLIVEYGERAPADYLLNNPVFINNWRLKIYPRKIERTPAKMRDYQQKNSPRETKVGDANHEKKEAAAALISALMEEKNFDDQLKKFLSLVQEDQRQTASLTRLVCTCLDKSMRPSFPKCQAIPFGSSVTGLSLIGSDLDIYLDICENIDEDNNDPTVRPPGWTQKTVFREAKSVLFRNPATFTKIIPIPMAKIPVIKFRHVATSVDCDISFKHSLGVHNSRLIKYLLTLDSRIKPMIIIIKYWARKLDMYGSGKINNYSLVMMIIFYLQQKNVNLLPTIRELQENCPSIEVKGWQVNFRRDYPQTTQNNPSSIPELIEGFFNFYAGFEFTTSVICPLDGTSPSRQEFYQRMTERGIDCDSLKLTRLGCLQDPIQLNHNIISGWTLRELEAIKRNFVKGVEVCLDSKDNPTKFLPGILSIVAKSKVFKTPTPFVFFIRPGIFATFGFNYIFDEEEESKMIDAHWFRMIYKMLIRILEKILKLEVTMVYDEIGLKQVKFEEDTDVHSKDRDKIVLSCKGNYCLNRYRKPKFASLDPTISPIEKEGMISDKVLEELKKRKDRTSILFTCVIEKQRNPRMASVTITDRQSAHKAFNDIGGFMERKIPNLVKKEFAHMVQFEKEID